MIFPSHDEITGLKQKIVLQLENAKWIRLEFDDILDSWLFIKLRTAENIVRSGWIKKISEQHQEGKQGENPWILMGNTVYINLFNYTSLPIEVNIEYPINRVQVSAIAV